MTKQAAPQAKLVHRTNNRLRLRIPSQKGNLRYFKTLADSCAAIEGISSVETNHLTGSVLFKYKRGTTDLINSFNQMGLFRIMVDDKGRLHQKIESLFVDADMKVTRATGGELNLAMLAFLVFGGAGIYQISRGNFNALPWYTALWYAFSLFKKTKNNNIS